MAANEAFLRVILSPLQRIFSRVQDLNHHFALIIKSTRVRGD